MADLADTLDGTLPFPGAEVGAFRPFKDVASTLGGVALDMTPVIGDVRNAQAGKEAFDAGDKLGMGLAAVGAIPLFRPLSKLVGGARSLRRSAKLASKHVATTADIPNLQQRQIPTEDRLLQFVDNMRSGGVDDDTINVLRAKAEVGIKKGIDSNDPAFVDAADDLIELAEGTLKLRGTGETEINDLLLSHIKSTVSTIEKPAVPRKPGRSGLQVETRIDRDPVHGDEIDEIFVTPDGDAAHRALVVEYRGSQSGNKVWTLNFDLSGDMLGSVSSTRKSMPVMQRVKVLASVEDSVARFIPREDPEILTFMAARTELNPLYDVAAKKFAKTHDYALSVDKGKRTTHANPSGRPPVVFDALNHYTLARKKSPIAEAIARGDDPKLVAERVLNISRNRVSAVSVDLPRTNTTNAVQDPLEPHVEDIIDITDSLMQGSGASGISDAAMDLATRMNVGADPQSTRAIGLAVDMLRSRTRNRSVNDINPDEAMELAFQALQSMERF